MKKLLEKHPGSLKDEEDILIWYRDHELYSLCYDDVFGIVSSFGYAHFERADRLFTDIFDVYAKAIDYTNTIIASKIPDVAMQKILTKISHRYYHPSYSESFISDGIQINVVTIEDKLGALIGLMVILFAYESIEDKSERLMKSFMDCRMHLEHLSGSKWYDYHKHPLMKLVAERIPEINDPTLPDVLAKVENLEKELMEKDEIIAKKNDEINELKLGYQTTEEGTKAYSTTNKIAILKNLLGIPNSLFGHDRAEFKKLCAFMTKAEDTTLERLLSMDSLTRMQEIYMKLVEEYPILRIE